jgi:hypothetical protein
MQEQALGYKLVYDGSGRSDVLTYTVTSGIRKSLNYGFKVLAINAIGESALSPELATFAAVVPTSPLSFTITGSTSGTVSVSWVQPKYDGGSKLLGYYVYYKLSGAGSYT